MKKIYVFIALIMFVCTLSACDGETAKVALVTDSGTINDESFNQAAWNGIKEYCEENNVSYKYYQPVEATNEERWTSINLAVDKGAEIVVLPGYLFNTVICDASVKYKDVKFVLLDGSYHADAEYGETYDETLEYKNVYCVSYQEEQSGYLAGYAAVKDGYTKLGFLGGMAVPAVVRFGYGYLQGISDAANELDINVTVDYTYGGDFSPTDASNALMKTWFSDGIEVVFACGGGIWNSVKDAVGDTGRMIGVDVDQAGKGDFIITSATKSLKETVIYALEKYFDDKWSDLEGKIENLGLGEAGDTAYVSLPTNEASWRFKTFKVTDYQALVAKIQKGDVTISSTSEAAKTDSIDELLSLSDNIAVTITE